MAKTVMIVDDDPSILLIVEKFLKTKGCHVMCMIDPEEAYHSAQKHRPDLIISDVAMPGLDGFTLLKALKSNKATEKIPLVLLTATDKIADVERGFEVGARAYILKPIDWDRAWAKLEPFLK
jgi:DNA-binding response OmpR family regulator